MWFSEKSTPHGAMEGSVKAGIEQVKRIIRMITIICIIRFKSQVSQMRYHQARRAVFSARVSVLISAQP
jgi:hypothetical protein